MADRVMKRVRIKKGVRPYGGRTFQGYAHTYPSGRTVWLLAVTGTASATAFGGLGQADLREYEVDEVEVLD